MLTSSASTSYDAASGEYEVHVVTGSNETYRLAYTGTNVTVYWRVSTTDTDNLREGDEVNRDRVQVPGSILGLCGWFVFQITRQLWS